MLRRFLYLDEEELADYLSALEGGLTDSVVRRRLAAGKGDGSVDARLIKAGGARSHEEEETFTISDTPQSRFDRLIKLAAADPELSGWVEVMDPDADLTAVGIGAMVELEVEIYVPDAVRLLANTGELKDAISMIDGLAPVAQALGLDTSSLPSDQQLNAIRAFTSRAGARLVVVGEFEDAEVRVAGELRQDFVQGELDGVVRLIGKVSKRWPSGQWKPLLALPGSSLLPRQKRRELERTPPKSDTEDQYLQGPACLLDILAIYR